jgi:putative flippase GtrA
MFAQSKRTLVERSWRYTLIGLICALLNYAIMLAVDAAGGYYLLGTTIAFVAVTPIGYLMHSRFTFAEPQRAKAFLRFVAGVASAYPIAAGLMVFLCSGLRLSVAAAWPIATVAIFGWNFTAAHWSILPRVQFMPAEAATQRAASPKEYV